MSYFDLVTASGQITGFGLLAAWAASQAVLLPVAMKGRVKTRNAVFKKIALAVSWPILGAAALVSVPFIAAWAILAVLTKVAPIASAILATIDPVIRKLDGKNKAAMSALCAGVDHPLQLALVERRSFGGRFEPAPGRQY